MSRSRRIALYLAIATGGCSSATSEPREVAVNQQIALAPGESARISKTSVELRLLQVNDSRCPSDVTCITAGEASSIIALSGGDVARTDTLRIIRQPTFTTYGGYKIEVVSVLPLPTSTGMGAPKTVTLLIQH